jgi:ATP/maltotriose-dependent transcriptional regulator MalT
MTGPGEALAVAREAARRGNWPEALAAFEALPEGCPLSADDHAAWADAAWWLGRVDECIAAYDRAFHSYLGAGMPREAAMTALGIGATFFLRGDGTGGAAWLGRSAELLADQPECPEQGYLLYLTEVEAALDGPDPVAVVAAAARRVRDLGHRHADPNLVALGLLGEGRSLLRQGDIRAGMALLDESMVLVLGGEVLPDWAGNVYCHLMSACHELADLRRARFWVEATARWLATLPAAVLFTGICRVHRSQVLQATGAWPESEREAARVCADLIDIAGAAAAEGHYQLGELARLRGHLPAAEQSFQQAHQLGRDPQPGLALVRAAQGRPDAAAASLRTALLVEAANPLARARLRVAQAEIALLTGDLTTADDAVEELTAVAESHASPGFAAAARHWRGALLLARRRPNEAMPCLHEACAAWRALQAPYDCARARVALAEAYRQLGDVDGAELELSAAAGVFERLGAVPDAAAVALLRGSVLQPGGLTDRELEVLTLLAAGRSNREIAGALVISGKTVARHLSNIFTKLEVGTRTAAAAWAHQHAMGHPTHSTAAPDGSNAR